jgi:hypothetical protein
VARAAELVAADEGPAPAAPGPVVDVVNRRGRARRSRPGQRDLAVARGGPEARRHRRRHMGGRRCRGRRPHRARPVRDVPGVRRRVPVRGPHPELIGGSVGETRHRVARAGDLAAADEGPPPRSGGAVLDIVAGRGRARRSRPGQRHLPVARGGPSVSTAPHGRASLPRASPAPRPSSPRRARRSSSGAGSRPAPGTDRRFRW